MLVFKGTLRRLKQNNFIEHYPDQRKREEMNWKLKLQIQIIVQEYPPPNVWGRGDTDLFIFLSAKQEGGLATKKKPIFNYFHYFFS